MNKCKQNRENEISKSINESLENKIYKQFWKEVKNKKWSSHLPTVIDGSSCGSDIINIFSGKFLNKNKKTHMIMSLVIICRIIEILHP